VVRAPNGSEDLIDQTGHRVVEDNLSTRSLLRSRVLQLDGLPVVELEDERSATTITPDGDPLMAAEQLECAAMTLLAAAHELRRGGGHHQVMVRLGQHQFIPWCSCGQSHGVVS
jgi:hypothetical protein